MRCTHCGSIIPPGVPRCPICGANPDSQQAQEDYRFYQQYPKTEFPPNAPSSGGEYGVAAPEFLREPESPNQYATPAFHTYRTQRFTGYTQNAQSNWRGQPKDGVPSGGFSQALSDLPQVIRGAFLNPAGTLQGMLRREDRVTGGILLFLSLAFAFLAGMVLSKGALGAVFAVVSGLTGLQFAETAASLNQGVNYLAGRVGVSVGGIAACCQLIAAFTPPLVTAVFLRAAGRMRISFVLLSGLTAVTAVPNVAALALASVVSLVSPYLAAVVLFFGQAVSYVLLCSMVARLDQPPAAAGGAHAFAADLRFGIDQDHWVRRRRRRAA